MVSLPLGFIAHLNDFLSEDSVNAFIESVSQPPRFSFRVNTLKTTVKDIVALFNESGITLDPIPWCKEGFYLPDDLSHRENLGNLLIHHLGLIYIQEASSMLPVSALFHQLEPRENFRLLDMCAAPGSKTTQLAARMDNKHCLVANELSSSRLMSLHANMIRTSMVNTALVNTDAGELSLEQLGQFDAILLDAPCTGEGTLRKDPGALDNWSLDSIHSMAEVQYNLLNNACQLLKPGGHLVYSTCTINRHENESVCLKFLDNHPDMALADLSSLFIGSEKICHQLMLRLLPHQFGSEPFFVCKFIKAGRPEPEPSTRRDWTDTPSKKDLILRDLICDYIQDTFDISLAREQLFLKHNTLWYQPQKSVQWPARVNRCGIKLAEVVVPKSAKGPRNAQNNPIFKLNHEWIACFGQLAGKNKVALSQEDAICYIQGKDIALQDLETTNPDVIVTHEGQALGAGKILKGKIKNKLPRHLVKDQRLLPVSALL